MMDTEYMVMMKRKKSYSPH